MAASRSASLAPVASYVPALATAVPTSHPAATTPVPVTSPNSAPFIVDLYRPGTFVSQIDREYCMAGAVQEMLNVIGPTVDVTSSRQLEIGGLIAALTTRQDSQNGGFGPEAWALALTRLGGGKYQLIVDPTFDAAMKDAALALARTSRPVGLLTWNGAHSWVMTGFRADLDPRLFPGTFKMTGAFIMDPFYPWVSVNWGTTYKADTFRAMPAMAHNFAAWKRPEGHYPGRDGKWLLVVPVNG